MLKPGQKVKVRDDTKSWPSGDRSPMAGQITHIIEFIGTPYIKVLNKPMDVYRVAADPNRPIGRIALWPIDDEPCDEDFLKEFDEIINGEKVNE